MEELNCKAISRSNCDNWRESFLSLLGETLQDLAVRLRPGTENGHVCVHRILNNHTAWTKGCRVHKAWWRERCEDLQTLKSTVENEWWIESTAQSVFE